MGRRKARDSSQKQHYAIHNEITAILLSLMERGETPIPMQSNREEFQQRRQLIQLLGKLSTLLEQKINVNTIRKDNGITGALSLSSTKYNDYQQNNHDNTDRNVDVDVSFLLLLEETALNIRSLCSSLQRDIIEKEGIEILQLGVDLREKQQQKHLSSSVKYQRVCDFGIMLVSQYCKQLRMEEKLLNEILSFLSSKMYGSLQISGNYYDDEEQVMVPSPIGTTGNDSADIIQHWINCLEERIFLDNQQWNNLALLIDVFQQQAENLPRSLTKTHEMGDALLAEPDMLRPPSINAVINEAKLDVRPSNKNVETFAITSIKKLVEVFVEEGYCTSNVANPKSMSFVLVCGGQGSGKTHLCDEIQNKIEQFRGVKCIRPSLPLDIMGMSVGDSENLVISLFACAQADNQNCVILLDGIEHILGDAYSGKSGDSRSSDARKLVGETEQHIMLRTRSTFLSIIDSLQKQVGENRVLVICTAPQAGDETCRRFDKVFYLQFPNEKERHQMFSNCLGIKPQTIKDKMQQNLIDKLLIDLVDMTMGQSYAEIAKYCRGAITSIASSNFEKDNQKWDKDGDPSVYIIQILTEVKRSLTSLPPESLRSAEDFVDMKVHTSRELLAGRGSSCTATIEDSSLQLPLYGIDAEAAWKKIEALIVTPLCKAKALDKLLYGNGPGSDDSAGRVVCAGVLLTGAPGSGKTALSYHCARVAATLLPTLTLLDVSCTSLVHKEVGGSERALQRLFAAARSAAPCIVLMDGIENIAAVRGNDNTSEGTMDRVLSTLLTELDGVDDRTDGGGNRGRIAVVGITHNPDWVDVALRRPGRLEKTIRLELPDFEARKSIFLNEIKKLPIEFVESHSDDNKSVPCCSSYNALSKHLASLTENTSAAEVIAVCDEARMRSFRRNLDRQASGTGVSNQINATMKVNDFLEALRSRKSGEYAATDTNSM